MILAPYSDLAWVALERPLEVVPMNDIREHVSGMRCWCVPEVDEDNITVHQALDRRDDFMVGRRKPS